MNLLLKMYKDYISIQQESSSTQQFDIIEKTYSSIISPLIHMIINLDNKELYAEYLEQGSFFSESCSLYIKSKQDESNGSEMENFTYLFRSYINLNPYSSIPFSMISMNEVNFQMESNSNKLNNEFIMFLNKDLNLSNQSLQLKSSEVELIRLFIQFSSSNSEFDNESQVLISFLYKIYESNRNEQSLFWIIYLKYIYQNEYDFIYNKFINNSSIIYDIMLYHNSRIVCMVVDIITSYINQNFYIEIKKMNESILKMMFLFLSDDMFIRVISKLEIDSSFLLVSKMYLLKKAFLDEKENKTKNLYDNINATNKLNTNISITTYSSNNILSSTCEAYHNLIYSIELGDIEAFYEYFQLKSIIICDCYSNIYESNTKYTLSKMRYLIEFIYSNMVVSMTNNLTNPSHKYISTLIINATKISIKQDILPQLIIIYVSYYINGCSDVNKDYIKAIEIIKEYSKYVIYRKDYDFLLNPSTIYEFKLIYYYIKALIRIKSNLNDKEILDKSNVFLSNILNTPNTQIMSIELACLILKLSIMIENFTIYHKAIDFIKEYKDNYKSYIYKYDLYKLYVSKAEKAIEVYDIHHSSEKLIRKSSIVESIKNNKLCLICKTNEKCYFSYPCNHLIICKVCFDESNTSNFICVECGHIAEKVLRIYN